VLLSVLAFLFFLRVVGQALVAFAGVTVLPPMSEWYSGLLPYRLLLPAQMAILTLQALISLQLVRGHGVLITPRPRVGRVLITLSVVYFLTMALRYTVTMTWYPERRWLGTGTIPVVFHWVLAAYVFTLGRHHARGAAG
jgi:hypothetical protein